MEEELSKENCMRVALRLLCGFCQILRDPQPPTARYSYRRRRMTVSLYTVAVHSQRNFCRSVTFLIMLHFAKQFIYPVRC